MAKAATGLTQTIDELICDKRVTIGQGIENLVAISKDAREIAAKLNAGIGSADELRAVVVNMEKVVQTAQVELPQLSDKTKKTMVEAEKALAAVNGILVQDKDRLRKTFANLETVSTNAVALTDDARVLSKKMRRGEGTVGALLSDEDIYDCT